MLGIAAVRGRLIRHYMTATGELGNLGDFVVLRVRPGTHHARYVPARCTAVQPFTCEYANRAGWLAGPPGQRWAYRCAPVS